LASNPKKIKVALLLLNFKNKKMEEKKKKILVVDDDENLRLALTDKLTIEGFDVVEAKDGKEGLDKAIATHPDLILLDVMMPVMNGLDMLKALRTDEWGKKVKVIMLTVLENAESVAEAMSGGSFTYLIKTSLNAEGIVSKIKEALKD
jgi:DNA-binding response OmpR family regulator